MLRRAEGTKQNKVQHKKHLEEIRGVFYFFITSMISLYTLCRESFIDKIYNYMKNFRIIVTFILLIPILLPQLVLALPAVEETSATYNHAEEPSEQEIVQKILTTEKIDKISDILTPIDITPVKGLKLKSDNCPRPSKKTKTSKTLTEDEIALQYINQEVSVDKNYVPPDLVDLSGYFGTLNNQPICLRSVVALKLIAMSKDMEKEGLRLRLNSGFRSFYQQATLYKKYAPKTKNELPIVARPGHSEHQTGYSFDLASDTSPGQFAYTPESDWVKNNSYKYGFLVSYPEKSEEKTGYRAEAWHIRYVGVENARVLHLADYTLAYKTAYYHPNVLEFLLSNLKRKILENNTGNEIGG
jgi:D-alanyl-D-alanine carboxypeptidase